MQSPTTDHPTLASRRLRSGRCHMGGSCSTNITPKYTRPRTATGTPATAAYELVVTFRQLTTPLSEQASDVEDVKCSKVR